MAIRETFIKTNDYARVHLFPVRKKADGRRAKRATPTTAIQEKYNAKCRENYLTDLLHLNFTCEDISLRLSYEVQPKTIEDAIKQVQLFLRRVKNYRGKCGLTETKYIYITEQGARGGRFHHHIVISGGISRDIIEKLWGQGYANAQRLQFNEDGLRGMAHYFGNYSWKERLTYRRWNSSKGLIKPVPKSNDYRISVKNAKYINSHPDDISFVETLYPEYVITKIETTPESDFTAGIFITLYMYKRDAKFLRTRPGKRKESDGHIRRIKRTDPGGSVHRI